MSEAHYVALMYTDGLWTELGRHGAVDAAADQIKDFFRLHLIRVGDYGVVKGPGGASCISFSVEVFAIDHQPRSVTVRRLGSLTGEERQREHAADKSVTLHRRKRVQGA